MVGIKSEYYAESNNLDHHMCAPNGDGTYPPQYADAINAIADDDPGFLAWQEVKTRGKMIVSPWQIRKALNVTGKRGQVNAAMNTADQDTQDGWEYALSFERLNPLVVGLGSALGLSDTDLDDLFLLAATL